MNTSPLGSPVSSFEEKYAAYEKVFSARKERSEQFFGITEKVAKGVAVIFGILGLAGCFMGSASFCVNYVPKAGAYATITGVALAILFTTLTNPIGLIIAGALCAGVSAVIGYKLVKLAARALAESKDIDYFSPKFSDREFSLQNKNLAVQREDLEKLFYDRYGKKEEAVVNEVQEFLRQEVEPRKNYFSKDREFSAMLGDLDTLAKRSEEAFHERLRSFSNQELYKGFKAYDETIDSIREQFEQAKKLFSRKREEAISMLKN